MCITVHDRATMCIAVRDRENVHTRATCVPRQFLHARSNFKLQASASIRYGKSTETTVCMYWYVQLSEPNVQC